MGQWTTVCANPENLARRTAALHARLSTSFRIRCSESALLLGSLAVMNECAALAVGGSSAHDRIFTTSRHARIRSLQDVLATSFPGPPSL